MRISKIEVINKNKYEMSKCRDSSRVVFRRNGEEVTTIQSEDFGPFLDILMMAQYFRQQGMF